MVDSTDDQDKQARDDENRQRERDVTETRNRADEAESPHDQDDQLGDFDAALDDHDYPTTADELVTAYGTARSNPSAAGNPSKKYLLRSTTRHTTPLMTFDSGYCGCYIGNEGRLHPPETALSYQRLTCWNSCSPHSA